MRWRSALLSLVRLMTGLSCTADTSLSKSRLENPFVVIQAPQTFCGLPRVLKHMNQGNALARVSQSWFA